MKKEIYLLLKKRMYIQTPITECELKERDYLFDNFRAYLIFMVVFGHLLRKNIFDSVVFYSIYTFVYLFHMIAFVFVSGYFSKNIEKCRDKAFETLLLPYILLDILTYVKGTLFDELIEPAHILQPLWGLWFFVALFSWRILLKDMIKIRYVIPLSFAAGLLCAFTPAATEKMALGRIIAFLPFFLLGYYCNREMIERRKIIPKFIPIAILILFGGFSILNWNYRFLSFESMYLRSAYKPSNEPWFMNSGFHDRIFIYISGILLTISFLCLMSKKKTIYSFIGQNSITVYIIHLILVPSLKKISIFDKNTMLYFLFSFISTIIITMVAALPIVKNGYDKFLNGMKKIILK